MSRKSCLRSDPIHPYRTDEAFVIDGLGNEFPIPSHFNKNDIFDTLQRRLHEGHRQLAILKASCESQCLQLNNQLENLQVKSTAVVVDSVGETTETKSAAMTAPDDDIDQELHPYWSDVLAQLKSQMTIDTAQL